MLSELGGWASEHLVSSFASQADRAKRQTGAYLDEAHGISKDTIEPGDVFGVAGNLAEGAVTDKFLKLVQVLLSELDTSSRAIIFVETRIVTHMLPQLLNRYPLTRDLVRSESFVSQNVATERHWDLVRNKDQRSTLADLKSGKLNTVVCTSVLEEGIDVSACNLVVSFDAPTNFKAFVQRRGRARTATSKIVIFADTGEGSERIEKWKMDEQELQKLYLSGERHKEPMKEADPRIAPLSVAGTNAQVGLDEAIPHLNHFCLRLQSGNDDDKKQLPFYTFPGSSSHHVRCTVTLPACVDPSLRETDSLRAWTQQNSARKDAALACYKKLHEAGLINDNLLPVTKDMTEGLKEFSDLAEDRKGAEEIKVDGQWGALVSLSKMWPWQVAATNSDGSKGEKTDLKHPGEVFIYSVVVSWEDETTSTFKLCSARQVPLGGIRNHAAEGVRVSIDGPTTETLSPNQLEMLLEFNSHLYQAAFSVEPSKLRELTLLFMPSAKDALTDRWIGLNTGIAGLERLASSDHAKQVWLIRSERKYGGRYLCRSIDGQLICQRLPKAVRDLRQTRVDALQHWTDSTHPSRAQTRVIEPSLCTWYNLPVEFLEQAWMVPSIIWLMQIRMTAAEASLSLWPAAARPFELQSLVEALLSPLAQEPLNYQRLEFLGDCLLKHMTCLNLTATYLKHPEGHLNVIKGRLVSNKCLQKAAMANQVVPYIITDRYQKKAFGLLPSAAAPARKLSTKTIADVVEAVIGATYLQFGPMQTISLMNRLIEDIVWHPSTESTSCLQSYIDSYMPPATALPDTHIKSIQQLLGTNFKRPALLLEATTHCSNLTLPKTLSYERLEFLGDAVLDLVVTKIIYHAQSTLPVPRMHLLRECFVNADILAFFTLSNSLDFEAFMPETAGNTIHIDYHKRQFPTPSFKRSVHSKTLISFLRTSPDCDLIPRLRAASTRYHAIAADISAALDNGTHYPWTLLMSLNAPKTISDVFEAVLGAVYVDNDGDEDASAAFLERFGLLPALRRAIEDEVGLWHPKEEFGQVAAGRKVRYEIQDRLPEETEEGDEETCACRLVVDKEELCKGEGISRRVAEARAAEKGIQILQQRKADETGDGAKESPS